MTPSTYVCLPRRFKHFMLSVKQDDEEADERKEDTSRGQSQDGM